MFTLSGYTISEKVYDGNKHFIYRGIRKSDQLPVIFKFLKTDYPSLLDIEKLKYEFEICKKVNCSNVIKIYDLENYRNTPVLVMEDIKGDSLKRIIKNSPLELKNFLKIAIKLVETIDVIHQHKIIHKDINPNNIILNLATEELRIIDFSNSTLLSKENLHEVNINRIEGTLSYMSPEQTGRMNRTLDYRSDYYSLGITFYEMLLGELPYKSTDELELVYCHIARYPIPPMELNAGIPETVSNIILKLMEKDAEKRYQSAAGLKSDLQKCLTQLEDENKIYSFELGINDVSDQFRIPQKLYGREQEIVALLHSFGRVGEGYRELMLVTGYSGIGKSSLVNEIHKPVIENRGFFVWGKFDQYKRNIPYSAFVYAFSRLIRQILTESTEKVAIWRERLLNALGDSGQIIIDVIPELEMVIGPQPVVPKLAPVESQNRFNMVFQKFVMVFCQKGRPLVIFLDDLQWADLSSLKLMEILLTDIEAKWLLLIGAFREQEVEYFHPLMLMLREIEKTPTRIIKLVLKPLEPEHVNQLLVETLNCKPEKSKPLARLCVQKTGGNPYFLNQFLTTLHRNNLIKFDPQERVWQWDINKIEDAGVTDNIVEMMVGKIQTLEPDTREIIVLAACIGNTFDLKTLSIISEKSPDIIAGELWDALEKELIAPVSGDYKYSGRADKVEIVYKFTHDRVQQAAYSLIDDSAKNEVHYKIGRLMLKNIPEYKHEEKLFEIVNHLNLGNELADSVERSVLAELNLEVGERAKKSGSYELAFHYFSMGIKLLGNDCWQTNYQLALKLHIEGMETAYLNLDFQGMGILMENILAHAKEMLDKVKVYEIKIQACMAGNNLQEAVVTAQYALNLLGVKLPKKAGIVHIILELSKVVILLLLVGKKVERLDELRLMSKPDKLAAMNIISIMITPLLYTNPNLALISVFRQISLTLRYGIAPASSYAYSTFGLFMIIIENINMGYKFGQLAAKIAEKFNFTQYKAKITSAICSGLSPWKDDIKELLNPLLEGYKNGLENGDFEYAAHCARIYLDHLYNIGAELNTVKKEMASFNNAVSRLKQKTVLNYMAIERQMILNISDPTENVLKLNGEAYNEDLLLPVHIREKDRPAILNLYLNKCRICFLFEEYVKVVELLDKIEEYYTLLKGNINYTITFYFYNALARLAIFQEIDKSKQKQYLQKINSSIDKMQKWVRYNSPNFLAKLNIMEGERARVIRNDLKAVEYYHQAIELSEKNGNLHEMALANELAARFFINRKMTRIAAVYMKNAHYCYRRWGANNKVAHLEQKYKDLLPEYTETINKTTTSTSNPSTILDMASILKATQTLSGEILLEKLLQKMIEIVIENAGAQKAYLIIKKGDDLVIEAEGNINEGKIAVMKSVPIRESEGIPISIINYVHRTKESVILDDATVSERFSTDIYIACQRPKSVLCVAIINKGDLKGILYLENNAITGAFTKDRIEILSILSSQIAISIENANLYSNLDELVRERTKELSETLENLKKAQNHLIESEKMAALGQLVAGIAHEINSPLGVIQASISNINDYLKESLENIPQLVQLLSAEQLKVFFMLLQRSVQSVFNLSAREERILKKDLMDKLKNHHILESAAVADILADMGIYDNLEPFLPLLKHKNHILIIKTAYYLSGLQRNSSNIKLSAERIAKMVFALKSYSRYDLSGEMARADITTGIETVLTIYHNQIKHGVEVVRNYVDQPQILCYPDELNQVWNNLIQNALYAMEYKGKIVIDVFQDAESVMVNITDSGKGIPPEIQEKIFEPFFTTKPQGEGTGLGLDIVKKIITKHQGDISLVSIPGKTTFSIRLPKR